MSVPEIDIPKSYRDGQPLYEVNLDDISRAVETWSSTVRRAFSQLGLDIFGADYQYNGIGSATRVLSVLETFAALAENETITGNWTFSADTVFSAGMKVYNGNDINVYSDAGTTSKFSVDGSTGNTNVGGTLTSLGAATFATTVTVTGAIILDGAFKSTNVRIFGGWPLIGYSDNGGLTETFRIYTSTGELGLKDVDPPTTISRFNLNSGVKAYGYWDDVNSMLDANYNIDSVTDTGSDGLTIVNIDTNMSSADYCVNVNPIDNISSTRFYVTIPFLVTNTQFYVYSYRVTENDNSANEVLLDDTNFSFSVFGK